MAGVMLVMLAVAAVRMHLQKRKYQLLASSEAAVPADKFSID